MGSERLHVLAQACREGRMRPEEVYDRIACEVYQSPLRYGFASEDEAAEALLRYRSRITGFVLRYTDRGVPFEAYLATSLRFLARSLRREVRRQREKEVVCERSEGWDAELRRDSSALPRLATPVEPLPPLERLWVGRCRGPSGAELCALRSRLIFLFLKCAWDVDEEATARVAAAAEVPADWLSAAVAQCRRSLESERLRFESLCGRRDRAWGRICLLEGRIRLEVEAQGRDRLLLSLEKERLRLERVRRELKVFRPTVPNSVVARVLGVPKGTVDSGLYYLRRQSEAASPTVPVPAL